MKDQSTNAALQAQYKLWRYSQAVGGRSVDAALLAEELAEMYNTPTPNAMVKARKIVLIECLFFYNKQGLIFIPRT